MVIKFTPSYASGRPKRSMRRANTAVAASSCHRYGLPSPHNRSTAATQAMIICTTTGDDNFQTLELFICSRLRKIIYGRQTESDAFVIVVLPLLKTTTLC